MGMCALWARDRYSCHGGFGYGSRNADGEHILEYAESHNLTIVNTYFANDRGRSLDTNPKVAPYETVAPRHLSLIYTSKIASPRLKQDEHEPRIKWWGMREKEAAVISRVRLPTVTTVDEIRTIRQAARLELGITMPRRRKVDKQAWLWTDDVKGKVREKK
ncbi:unnamed protein product [Heligmosomoides polygyrus]|uniref:Aldo_ket_red domain-containing protein n=1 Tax=Heligmosomoides polygyrus TaxID=6339 RepID=A0A183FMC2_HELPZ|nr:unnamed protein product [Heligmosomoides polygyrus]